MKLRDGCVLLPMFLRAAARVELLFRPRQYAADP
jgi:hypothetical protein